MVCNWSGSKATLWSVKLFAGVYDQTDIPFACKARVCSLLKINGVIK